jgi:hypothetical protein
VGTKQIIYGTPIRPYGQAGLVHAVDQVVNRAACVFTEILDEVESRTASLLAPAGCYTPWMTCSSGVTPQSGPLQSSYPRQCTVGEPGAPIAKF